MTIQSELDAKILDMIKSGYSRFSEIWERSGVKYREVDRRLQSLRRRGLIAYARGAWQIVEPTR